MSGTKISRCECKHKGQDELHGKHRRVFNRKTKPPDRWVCTVCGKEKGIAERAEKGK